MCTQYAQNKIVFSVGVRVRVKPDYRDAYEHRNGVGIVEYHKTNPSHDMDAPFIDNYIRFENGVIEPFGNWELITETTLTTKGA